MREIKYRGLRKDNNEWVYGYFMTSSKEHHMGERSLIVCDDRCAAYAGRNYYEVIPESVGEFTGLKDKNEKDLYDGDIIKHGVIYFDERYLGFFVKMFKQRVGEEIKPLYDVLFPEWIGTIHQNPELLNQ